MADLGYVLVMPEAMAFSDVFASWGYHGTQCVEAYTKMPGAERLTFSSYACLSDSFWSFSVVPKPEMLERLAKVLVVDSDDSLTTKVVIRHDNSALIVVQYDTIIASRWVALVDPATLPQRPILVGRYSDLAYKVVDLANGERTVACGGNGQHPAVFLSAEMGIGKGAMALRCHEATRLAVRLVGARDDVKDTGIAIPMPELTMEMLGEAVKLSGKEDV
jgi:hypothetical protein